MRAWLNALFFNIFFIAHLFGMSWMEEQIDEDLAGFAPCHITTKDLERVMDSVLTNAADVAHIVIQGKDVSVKRLRSGGWWGIEARLHEIIKELRRWQSVSHVCPSRRLPNCEFLLSLGDGLDTETSEASLDPSKLPAPIFVFCKKKSSKHLALFPDNHALKKRQPNVHNMRSGSRRFPWWKKDSKLFWRGAGSDGIYRLNTWESLPRAKLVLLSQKMPHSINAGFTKLPQTESDQDAVAILNIVGGTVKPISPYDHLAYKYLMDIDGNSNGWERCFWALLSNSVLFKQKSPYSQWFYKALKPWIHYVPIKRDLSDLKERVTWAQEHDLEAYQIACNGRALGQEIFERKAIFSYIQRLLTKYAERFGPPVPSKSP